MKLNNILSLVSIPFILFSCGEKETTQAPEQETVNEVKQCEFTYDASTTLVNWTAFKLSEKVGVNGSFDSVVVTNTKVGQTVEEVLSGATFEIFTSTVNSKDSIRDWKLANKFFGMMNAPEKIYGTITELHNGSGLVSLTMNGKSVKTEVKYTVKEDNKFMLTTTINVPDWDAQMALDSLGNVCAAKHTGEDGIKKLWPDVEVKVFTDLIKTCN